MPKSKKELTTVSKILLFLLSIEDLTTSALLSVKTLRQKGFPTGSDYDRQRKFIHYLLNKGLIKVVDKNNEKFIKLTSKGELEALFIKAKLTWENKKWDGKWRIIIFDIPEESKEKRKQLRKLLRLNHFKFLQASVYASPYALNREAVKYLKMSGLIEYIRILKVQEMDDDTDLKRKFSLK